jgi:hypothetical protein
MVQSNHATLTIAGSKYDFAGIPNIVLIGVPDIVGLQRVERKLADNGIPHVSWHEPDGDMGFTAIATIPLTAEEKKCLSNYRLWHPISACTSEKEGPADQKSSGKSVVQVHPGAPVQNLTAVAG